MSSVTSDRLDALLAVPRLITPSVSPDGRWAAWAWLGAEPTADIYAALTDGSSRPIRLTTSHENAYLVSWSPDSRSLVVEQDHGGDERVQLLRVDPASPGKTQQLTEPEPAYFIRGGQLHPNGRWLVYGMNFDVSSGDEIEATWIYRHDLETGERRPLARPQKPAFSSPALNRAGTHILYERSDLDPSGSQVWLVDIEGREDREILNVGASRKAHASWFPDSRRAVFVAEADIYRRVGVWDLESGQTRLLIDDPSRSIEEAYVPDGSDRIVVLEVREARTFASLLDPETGDEAQLALAPGTLIPLRPLAGGEWVGHYGRSTQPGDLVRFSLPQGANGALRSLTGVWDRTSLRTDDLSPAEDFRWRSIDGLEIQGWLYRAEAPARGTVVHVHGGPTAHSEDMFSALPQFLVAQGFNVLQPNYRGSTGFGLAFMEAIKEDGWGGREQDDIRAGIEALISSGVAQAGKVGITGTSYGGYSSWCAITRWRRSIVAASAPVCGMTDLVVDYLTTRPDLRPYSEEMMGGRPEEVPQRYRERSPIHFVDRIEGELLIVQGLRDPNVSPENVEVVRRALDAAGISYEILAFEDEGHGIMRRDNQRVLYRRLDEFFARAFA